MQVMTSGFGETPEGKVLEQDLKAALVDSGIRLLGPNCIGMYSSSGLLSFIENSSFEPGSVSVVSHASLVANLFPGILGSTNDEPATLAKEIPK